MKRIAVILTVFNRREKTLACLNRLFEALHAYQHTVADNISLYVFLTDDGCTDGTADAVRAAFADKDIQILQGTGSLFWAGGMRLAWQAAIDTGTPWDYYLLLNDDTNVFHNVFEQLLEADAYGFKQTGCHGLASGITCQPGNPDEATYGGVKFTGRTKGRFALVQPSGIPQAVDSTHANILLVHKDVVSKIGIFYKGYRHGQADVDYSMMCNSHKMPVYVTAQICGECEFDHDSNKEEIKKLMRMTFAERKAYVNSPTHSDYDYLLRIRRNIPMRFPLAWLIRNIRLYFPKLYYRITHLRGIYK